MSAKHRLAFQHLGGQPVHVGGPGVDAGIEQCVEAALDVSVVAERQGGDADDPRMSGAEARRLHIDDGPARADFGCRPGPTEWLTFRGWHGAPTNPAIPPNRSPACRLPKMPGMVTTRGRIALAAGAGARWASRVTGRGAGAMIGGLVVDDAGQIDPSPARPGPSHSRGDRHERQIDHHPDDRGGAGHAGDPSRPTPRAPTWTQGWWPRSPERATRRWPRWRSTRCTCRTWQTQSTRR